MVSLSKNVVSEGGMPWAGGKVGAENGRVAWHLLLYKWLSQYYTYNPNQKPPMRSILLFLALAVFFLTGCAASKAPTASAGASSRGVARGPTLTVRATDYTH